MNIDTHLVVSGILRHVPDVQTSIPIIQSYPVASTANACRITRTGQITIRIDSQSGAAANNVRGITGDQDQKEWIRYYADQRSSDEWTVLETYPIGEGSFEEFKEELISHYPEATDSAEGSITRLDKLCAKSRPLTAENLSAMLEFIRGFKFEGRKLLNNRCISNREIVTKFLSCLDADLKRTVVWQVSQLSLNGPVFQLAKNGKRNHVTIQTQSISRLC